MILDYNMEVRGEKNYGIVYSCIIILIIIRIYDINDNIRCLYEWNNVIMFCGNWYILFKVELNGIFNSNCCLFDIFYFYFWL